MPDRQGLIDLAQATPQEFKERIAKCPAVAMGIGTVEWHNAHLPLGFDTLKADALCRRIADEVGCFVAPPLFYGYAYHFYQNKVMPAMYCDLDAFREYLKSTFKSFYETGFRVIFALSGHYENLQLLTIRTAAQMAMDELKDLSVICHQETDYTMLEGCIGDHAGPYETSLAMTLMSGLVHLDEMPNDVRQGSSAELGERLAQIIVHKAAEEIKHALAHPGWVQPKSWVIALGDMGKEDKLRKL